jgi:hypothetical protein
MQNTNYRSNGPHEGAAQTEPPGLHGQKDCFILSEVISDPLMIPLG